ncbi:MAG: phosphoesterase family protein, partial [Acidobacteria bacterium]|nr:phosphoesterase family protein [Acidobacteriota bacterium]
LLVITFDEAESGDATACCNEMPGLNTFNPGGTTLGPGGGRSGAVLISQFIRPGSVNDVPYNHYSLLRSIEDIFALPHLGFAGQPGLQPFGADVYDAP